MSVQRFRCVSNKYGRANRGLEIVKASEIVDCIEDFIFPLNNEDIIQISNNTYKSLNNNEIYNIKKVIYQDIVL